MAFFSLRGLWIYFTCFVAAIPFGCSRGDEDLTGVWVSTRKGEEMRLELRKDGTFIKTTQMEFPSVPAATSQSLTVRQIGKYRIENGEIVFYDFKEGLKGKEFTYIKRSIRIPYSRTDGMLIWNPGTAKKRAFTRARNWRGR